ncbi:MAG: Ferredoxin thioredoxin reductase catalytic beta chain [Syntrophorhabdaceae bacterium PtaU1.Bin034]|nr:MAG: Ferredoxin thioredoxin reductase catalytic beta chain [Syntrophorhabdaceae bacterium PtaU1.Bin034]
MTERREIPETEIDDLYRTLRSRALSSGYFINPDEQFTRDLIRSLIINQDRYGYPSCPCRLASGDKEADTDIVCPCDYRDPDLNEYGACYCALYVSGAVCRGEKEISPVPERRPARHEPGPGRRQPDGPGPALPYPVWRCRVCGYLCAREEPPEICPICKVTKDRFERFM